MRSHIVLFSFIFASMSWAADVRAPYPSLVDSSGAGIPLSKSLSGDSGSGKVGSVSFSFLNSSSQLVLPQLNAGGNVPVTFSNTSINAVQSGTWTTGRTWSLLNSTDSVNAVQSGTWTVQQGTPPWSVSQSGSWTTGRTWTLASGTDSVSVVQSTSPWVANISQFGGSNVVTGTGASGSGIPRVTVANDSNVLATQSGSWSVTANAGTNLNTSALALSANQTNGTQKNQVVDGSGNVQPSGDVAARKIFTALTDGTNTTAVKAASTAALATDPSAVIAFSPNSPLPTGTNSVGQVTANAGTNLNTSALATSANLTAGTAKVQPVDASGNVQPAGDTVGRASFVKLTDGTNTQAVKAASTAPVSTDPSAVVSVSSNFANLTGTTGTAVSVGTGSTATVASNTNRAGLILVDTSVNRVSCTVGTAVLNSGVTLFPGGVWVMDQYSFTTAAINCIAGAAASNVSVQEFTK